MDAVLTFSELAAMFKEARIEPEQRMDKNPHSRARLFPTAGGILKTMDLPDNGYTYVAVDGPRSAVRPSMISGRKCPQMLY